MGECMGVWQYGCVSVCSMGVWQCGCVSVCSMGVWCMAV